MQQKQPCITGVARCELRWHPLSKSCMVAYFKMMKLIILGIKCEGFDRELYNMISLRNHY